MKFLKRICIVIILIGFNVNAQENVFLNRDFWDTNPTVETVEAKIKAGNDPAQNNAFNFDGVVYAILQQTDNKTIQHLISKEGNSVNKLTHDGRTYIFWAAYKGNTELMEYLLENGAKTDIVDDHGNTILNFAASAGQQNTKVYDLCLTNGANLEKDLNHDGANALLLAAPSDKDFKLIEYFTSKGLDLNSTDADGNDLFNYVTRTGNIQLLKKLMAKGIKGTDQAFVFAAQGTRGKTNSIEFFKFLESVGLNPKTETKEGTTPLHIVASRNKDAEIVKYFFEKGLDANQSDSQGNTPFMNAARSNTLEIVQLLYRPSHGNSTKPKLSIAKPKNEAVVKVNTTNKKGETALSLAVAGNSPEVVAFLLKNRADVKVVDSKGNNLAYYLMQSINPRNPKSKTFFNEKAELLKQAELDVSQPQKNGNTLIHLAVEKGNPDLLEWALEQKTDINAKNKHGLTPLHLSAMTAKSDTILKTLLKNGADKTAVTDFEETVYDLASENELLKVNEVSIEFLK